MNTNLLPAEATRTTLDLFQKQPLLVTIDNAFAPKVSPSCSPNGPMLVFEVVSDRENYMESQNFYVKYNSKSREPMTLIWELTQRQQTHICRILSKTLYTLCFQSVQSK